MELQQAAQHFATSLFAGWDGTEWVAGAVIGAFQPFDRFISARTFGQKKRNLLVPQGFQMDPKYVALRSLDGTRYLIVDANADIDRGTQYQHTYLLQQADFDIEVIQLTTTDSASGLGGALTETVSATTFGDMERITAMSSDEFEVVDYTNMAVYLPSTIAVTTADLIRVSSGTYDIKEVLPLLGITELRTIRREAA